MEEMVITRERKMVRENERAHVPVLLSETIDALRGDRSPEELEGWILDGTLGAGGHTRAILETFPNVRVFGTDQDPAMLAIASEELSSFGDRVQLARGRISHLCALCTERKIDRAIGVLFDLGASSVHFDDATRGFSFQQDGPLDMRMDPTRRRTAADIVNTWDESDLADLFYYEGGERRSRRIAHAIVESRRRAPFQRTLALADVISRAVGGRQGVGGKIDPATRVFQSLRRAVNEEGHELRRGLRIAEHVLVEDGRLVVLTFHSGEDGVVKRYLSERARDGRWQLVTKKPLGPGATERRSNPRARSARLRLAIRGRAGEVTEDCS